MYFTSRDRFPFSVFRCFRNSVQTRLMRNTGVYAYNVWSAVTRIELLGIFFKFLVLLMKSFESLIYDYPFCVIGFG